MFRLASVVGIVALTLAAAALATAAQPAEQVPQDNDTETPDDAVLRITPVQRPSVPSFHARFSLN